MLSKCANPACSKEFRYLHQGKLYVIEAAAIASTRDAGEPIAQTNKLQKLEHYWLCDTCCRTMKVIVDGNHQSALKVMYIEGSDATLEPLTDRGLIYGKFIQRSVYLR